MKRSIAIAGFLFLFVVTGLAQPERRVIEVSGSAEQMVIPNEFTFKLTLLERIDNKRKITIEQQEATLRSELTTLGVDVAKDLSIYDISSTYFRQKKLKDVLGFKDYRLKIRDLAKIARLQDLADRLNIARLELLDSEHTDIARFRRETKTEAVKAAKAKAEYLLAAIGQRIGPAVYIKEVEEESSRNRDPSLSSNAYVVDGVNINQAQELSFAAIKLRFVIVAKFEIE